MAKLHVSSSSKPKNQGNNKSFKSGGNSWWSGSGVKPSVAMAGLAALGIGGAFPLVSKVIAPTVGGIGKSFASLFGSNGSKNRSTQNDTTSGAIEKNRATAANSSINNLTKVTKKGFADVLKAMGAKEDPKKKKKSLWDMLMSGLGSVFGGSGGGFKMPTILPLGGGGFLKTILKWSGIGILSNYLGHNIREALGIHDSNRGEKVAHFVGDTISGGIALNRGKAKYISTLNKLNRAKNIKNIKNVVKTGKLATLGLRGTALAASAGTAATTFGLSLLVEEVVMQGVVNPIIHHVIRKQNQAEELAGYAKYRKNNYSMPFGSVQDNLQAVRTIAHGGGGLSLVDRGWSHLMTADKDKVWMPLDSTPKEIREQVAQLNTDVQKETDLAKKRKLLDQRDKLYKKYFYRTTLAIATDDKGVESFKNLIDMNDETVSPEKLIGEGYNADKSSIRHLIDTSKKTQGALVALLQNAAANRVLEDYKKSGGWENMSTKEALKYAGRTFGYNSAYYNNPLAIQGIKELPENTLKQKAIKIKQLFSTGQESLKKTGLEMLNSLSESDRIKVFASQAAHEWGDEDYFKSLNLPDAVEKQLKKQYSRIRNTGHLEYVGGLGYDYENLKIRAASDNLEEYTPENMAARAQNVKPEEKEDELKKALTHTETTDLLAAQNQLDQHLVELTGILSGREVQTIGLSGNEMPEQGGLSLQQTSTTLSGPSAFADYMQKLKNLQSPYGYGEKVGSLSLGN